MTNNEQVDIVNWTPLIGQKTLRLVWPWLVCTVGSNLEIGHLIQWRARTNLFLHSLQWSCRQAHICLIYSIPSNEKCSSNHAFFELAQTVIKLCSQLPSSFRNWWNKSTFSRSLFRLYSFIAILSNSLAMKCCSVCTSCINVYASIYTSGPGMWILNLSAFPRGHTRRSRRVSPINHHFMEFQF